MAQSFVAARRDQVIVFDAEAADAVDVQPRFERYHIPGDEFTFGMGHEEGGFGVSEAQAVPGVVDAFIARPGAGSRILSDAASSSR